ncbi:MAG TPA: superoxide dismutase family protein [Polyangiales bacterium]|nr:superoxide dismutase family protein [Polyangiales bacterium]
MRFLLVLAIGLGAIAVGCGGDDADGGEHDDGDHNHETEGHTAQAMLMPKSGNATLAGTVKFSGEPGKVQVMVTLMGAPAGMHGLHIHETGDCSAADAMSAGGHWNPSMHMHAAPGPNAHLGDLGNITVDASGNGTLTATNAAWEIGTGGAMDLIGKAVIVHAMPDDLMTQPTGNAGGRIGCGAIAK